VLSKLPSRDLTMIDEQLLADRYRGDDEDQAPTG
jgi:hypothetical protein